MVSSQQPQTKNERRQQARETAKAERERRERIERRRRWLLPTGVTAALAGVVAIVVAVMVIGRPAADLPAGPANMASDGIVFTAGAEGVEPLQTDALAEGAEPVETDTDAPLVQTYVDWSCPACRTFEANYAAPLEELAASGDIALEVHPIAILDNAYAGSMYSTRTANVAACVAAEEPASFLAVQNQFYANQPAEGTTGLTDDQMLELVAAAGVDSTAVTECVTDTTYADWVAAATERAPITGTPTVYVAGEQWDPNVQPDLLAFIDEATA